MSEAPEREVKQLALDRCLSSFLSRFRISSPLSVQEILRSTQSISKTSIPFPFFHFLLPSYCLLLARAIGRKYQDSRAEREKQLNQCLQGCSSVPRKNELYFSFTCSSSKRHQWGRGNEELTQNPSAPSFSFTPES